MSDTSAVYILQNRDGYRVHWGSYLEELLPNHIKLFEKAPKFKDYFSALHFAEEVEKTNQTENDLIILDKYKEIDFNDIGKFL